MIQVINRAIDILEMLSRNVDRPLGLADIANRLELNHGTCANIIKTLINRGYIEKTNGYKLGHKVYYLSNNFSDQSILLSKAIEALKTLKKSTNESCILAILQDNVRVTLHKETSEHELQAITRDEKDAYLTATGRTLIANMIDKDRIAYIKKYGLPGTMWPEVSSEEDLITKLDSIAKEQIALHYAESEIVGVAVPLSHENIVHASIGIYLPLSRFKSARKEFLITQLRETAVAINSAMKYGVTKND